MSTPATSEEVRALLKELKQHDERNAVRFKGIYDKLEEQGMCLARMDERTAQHEKRMDRAEKRAAASGSIAGTLSGSIVAVILSKLGLGGGG